MCWIQRIAPLEIRSAMGFEDHYVNIPGAHHQSVAVSSNQWKHNVNVGGPDFASLMTHLRRESYDILKIAAFQTASMQQGHIGFLKHVLFKINYLFVDVCYVASVWHYDRMLYCWFRVGSAAC